jgi:hypothetical protein
MRAEGQTDRQTDITKSVVGFCNFAKVPKNAKRGQRKKERKNLRWTKTTYITRNMVTKCTRSEALTVISSKHMIFWHVMPCNLVHSFLRTGCGLALNNMALHDRRPYLKQSCCMQFLVPRVSLMYSEIHNRKLLMLRCYVGRPAALRTALHVNGATT